MTRRVGRALFLAAAVAAISSAPAAADRALLIGIDRYADARLSSAPTGATEDLAAMRALLTGELGYGDADIRAIAGAEATRVAVLEAIDTFLVGGTRAGERVFLYFSGFGYFAEDDNGDEADGVDETLLPYDAGVGSGDAPSIGNVISDDEIRERLLQLTGRQVTMAVDAGHAGFVSQAPADIPSGAHGVKAPVLDTKTRAIVVEPRVKAQKAEGSPFDAEGLGSAVSILTAASGGQAPLIEHGGGVFTQALVEAVRGRSADVNGNGLVSNAEILGYVRDRSKAACAANSWCTLGLTPTLEPASAAGLSPWPEPSAIPAKLDAGQVLDYFAKGNAHGVTLEQHPPSPVRVGTRDIRFRIVSPSAGNLILLDLSDEGDLVQLFPNEHTRGDAREGVILAGSPITVPDDYYGISFNATSATSGTLIALVTTEPIEMPATVKTRKISVIPKAEATESYLPGIAGALAKPLDTALETETRAVDWSVATLRYEMVE